ncbi:leucine-rich repeat-containing protein 15-like [Battus philenor]|uniref:leucine-rich repeat-containing protein 15-like n=1 Tax=Battus philenor TaxID=42288 RepID=UPI0035D10D1B
MKLQTLTVILSFSFIVVDATITCRYEDDTQMFHKCRTDDFDNVLRRGIVSDKRKTFHIILNRCQISSIEPEAFYRLPALVILDLSENKVENLQLGVFDRLVTLSHLNLSYNLLADLPVGIFDKLQNLSELDLEGNRLKNLQQGIFDHVPRLYLLDLSYNSIVGKNLNPEIFNNKRDISILTLSGNDMTEAPFLSIMHNINYLFMNKCRLKEVPKITTASNMKKLRHLSLSSNEILYINDSTIFNNLIDMQTLNLSYNYIEYINEDTFKGLTSLEVLDLRFNKLRSIPVNMFQNIQKLYELRLSHNFLRSVPMNAFAGTELERLSFDHNNITYLHENFLLKIEDAGLMLKFIHFKNNPWQCACLRDLLREVKEIEVKYDTDVYDGEHAVCVTKEFVCKRDPSVNDEFITMYNDIL